MLNIEKTESKNIINVVGILKELELEEKVISGDKQIVSGKATIRVD